MADGFFTGFVSGLSQYCKMVFIQAVCILEAGRVELLQYYFSNTVFKHVLINLSCEFALKFAQTIQQSYDTFFSARVCKIQSMMNELYHI